MNKTDEALAGILNKLADKFGTTVEHLYAILIKQAFIEGIESVLSIIIMLVISFVLYRIVQRGIKNHPKDAYMSYFEDHALIATLSFIVGVVTFMCLMLCVPHAIDCFFNPEYYALNQIIK